METNMPPARVAPHIRWCFSTLGCPDETLEQAADLALSFGIKYLELRFLEGSLDLEKVLVGRYGSLSKVRERMDAMGITLASLDASTRMADGKADDFRQLESLAHLAHGLGVGKIRVFDGGPKGVPPTPEFLESAGRNLTSFREYCRRRGLSVAPMVETHDMLTSSGAVGQWAGRFGDARDLLWDSHHTWAVGGDDPVAFFKAFKSRVVHIHLKDSLGLGPDGKPRYAVFGGGRFPFAALLDSLVAEGYGGLVSVEWEKKWHPYLPSLETCLRSLRATGYL